MTSTARDAFLADTRGWAADLGKQALAEGFGVEPSRSARAARFPSSPTLRGCTAGPDPDHGRRGPALTTAPPNESQDVGPIRAAILAEALFWQPGRVLIAASGVPQRPSAY